MMTFLLGFLLCIPPSIAEENIEKLHQLWRKRTEESLISQVEKLHYAGQFIEAQTVLDFLIDEHFSSYVFFLWAQNSEYRKDFEIAIEAYQDLLQGEIDPYLRIDVSYRIGIAYDDNKQHRKAIRIWKNLLKDPLLAEEYIAAIQLLIGTAYIHNHQDRKGALLINKTIDRVNREQNWMKARARNALAMVLIRQADAISLSGKTAQSEFQKRMELLKKAEDQVIASVHLHKTVYVLQGVIQMIDAYLRLYDDSRTIMPPTPLPSHKETYYFHVMEEKSHHLLILAENYAVKGVQMTKRDNWKGPETQMLEDRVLALRKEKKKR